MKRSPYRISARPLEPPAHTVFDEVLMILGAHGVFAAPMILPTFWIQTHCDPVPIGITLAFCVLFGVLVIARFEWRDAKWRRERDARRLNDR